MKRLIAYLLVLGISACANAPQPRSLGDGTGTAQTRAPAGEVGGVVGGTSSASATLIAQGRAQLAAGDAVQATASIERALRIEPRNSFWWVELGVVRLAEGDRQQALSLGQKALRLAGSDSAAQAAARQLIDQASNP